MHTCFKLGGFAVHRPNHIGCQWTVLLCSFFTDCTKSPVSQDQRRTKLVRLNLSLIMKNWTVSRKFLPLHTERSYCAAVKDENPGRADARRTRFITKYCKDLKKFSLAPSYVQSSFLLSPFAPTTRHTVVFEVGNAEEFSSQRRGSILTVARPPGHFWSGPHPWLGVRSPSTSRRRCTTAENPYYYSLLLTFLSYCFRHVVFCQVFTCQQTNLS